MDAQRFEVESEAWYRAVAEGKLVGVSDRNGDRVLRERVEPNGYGSTAVQWGSPARFVSARD